MSEIFTGEEEKIIEAIEKSVSNIPAGNISSGTLAIGRIPNIPATKLVNGGHGEKIPSSLIPFEALVLASPFRVRKNGVTYRIDIVDDPDGLDLDITKETP